MMTDRGLYIHIPFCSGKCYYCDFYSVSINTEKADFFTNKIITEILYFANLYPDTRITSIYIGGGTPSILPFKYLKKIVKKIFESFFVVSDEFTIEVNPSEIQWIHEYLELGINRISLGIQSLDDNVLKLCGRRHDSKSALIALDELNNNYSNISCDLILGLPGQTTESAIKDVNILSNYAKHLSLYLLKIAEGTKFYQLLSKNKLVLPDEDSLVDTYYLIKDNLKRYGYDRYEISNFAKEGYKSIHNLAYWDRKEYIGVGPSACSLLNNERIRISSAQYFQNKISEYVTEETLSIEDMAKETIILSLRTDRGIDLNKFEKLYGKNLQEMFPEAMNKNNSFFVISKEGFLRLREDLYLVQNRILEDFI